MIKKHLCCTLAMLFIVASPAGSQPANEGTGTAAIDARQWTGTAPEEANSESSGDTTFDGRLPAIDAFIANSLERQRVPAYCFAIIKSGKVVFKKSYGYADLKTRQPTTSDTVFGLASLTKTFTALTLLSLVDKGLIDLDAPLSRYLSGLTRPYQPLTIRQLASMTAGVPSKLPQEVEWANQLEILDRAPLICQPGSEFHYSNFSYRLLGSVISSVTRRPYLEVVRETILQPLNMESTATTVLLQPTGRVARAYGDNAGRGPVREIEYKNPAVSYSAGMLASTQNDLIKYVFALLSNRMLSKEGMRTLWVDRPPLTTGLPCQWAFGWKSERRGNLGGQLVVSMNGGTPGVASMIMILPESNSAVIALSNLRKPPVYAIAKNVFEMAFADGNQTNAADDTDAQTQSQGDSD